MEVLSGRFHQLPPYMVTVLYNSINEPGGNSMSEEIIAIAKITKLRSATIRKPILGMSFDMMMSKEC